jgi:hypothetical protein
MHCRSSAATDSIVTIAQTIAVAAALSQSVSAARAFDDAIYPDLKGQWHRAITPAPRFDQSKPPARGQGAPLTAEYQAKFEANLKDIAEGGQGDFPTYTCLVPGMPMMMTAYEPMEVIVLPEITHIRIDHVYDSHRRIFTDGRSWPDEQEPSFEGYSIGHWIDTDGDGRFDVLEVETRNFKGPRAYDNSGLILHPDNQSVIKERISLDKADRNILHDEITVIDDALTRPWTVMKSYRRDPSPRPVWHEDICEEGNQHVKIGAESYYFSADRLLMPTKKGQAAPDLKYFRPRN